MHRLLLVVLALFVLPACASDTEPSDCCSGTEPPPSPTDTGQPIVLEDSWVRIDGELGVVDGEVASGALQTELLKRDPVTGDLEPLCSRTSAVDAPSTVVPPVDDVTVYGMWSIPIDNAGCEGMPASLNLGIGPLLPILWPSVEQVGVSVRHTRGLYSTDEGALVVFGLAGTAEQRAGQGTPASLTPLPNGTYLLDGIYLLPL